MLPLSVLKQMLKAPDPGYATVYMFDENAAQAILLDRHSSGFGRYPVYTEELVMDLDGGEEQLKLAEAALKAKKLGYTVWFSGGKGYHIYIKLTKMVSGKDVPYSQKKYVEALGIGADLSLYQHGRIISLPGRVHPKTKQKKRKVKEIVGAMLELPMLIAPEQVFTFNGNGGLNEFEAALWKILTLLNDEPSPGNRHTQLWSTALHLADAGFSYDTALELMTEVNDKWKNPKDPAEVEMAVKQAYKK